MKRLALITLVALALAAPLPAQDTPPMVLVYDEVPKLDRIANYEKASKRFFEVLMKAEPEVRWTTVMTDDFHYHYVIPIRSLADVDAIHGMMQAMEAAVGKEQWTRMMAEAGSTTDYFSSTVAIQRDDLSYRPATPFNSDEARVIEYGFYSIRPGMEPQAEQIARDYAAIWKKLEMKHPFTVYQPILGSDMPGFVVVTPARSEAELAEISRTLQEKSGAEGRAIDQRAMNVLRKYDRKTARIRPDLSSAAFRPAKRE